MNVEHRTSNVQLAKGEQALVRLADRILNGKDEETLKMNVKIRMTNHIG